MEHLTASTSAIPFSGEDWFDPLEEAIRFRVRAFIEALVAEEAQAALASLWSDIPVQRCNGVHKERNLLAHAPKELHDEVKAGYTDMMYGRERRGRAQEAQGFPALLPSGVETQRPTSGTSLRKYLT